MLINLICPGRRERPPSVDSTRSPRRWGMAAVCALRTAGVDELRSLIGQGRDPPPGVDAFGCLRSLRARSALDGVSWVQGG